MEMIKPMTKFHMALKKPMTPVDKEINSALTFGSTVVFRKSVSIVEDLLNKSLTIPSSSGLFSKRPVAQAVRLLTYMGN